MAARSGSLLALAVLVSGAAAAQEPRLPPRPQWVSASVRPPDPPGAEIAALYADAAANEESARRQGARLMAVQWRDRLLRAGLDPDFVNQLYEDLK